MQYPPIGVRVLVPLGRKTITGVVYRPHEGALPDTVKLREVLDILDEQPVVTAYQLRLWEWLSQYYMCTMGEVMAAALPSGIIDDDYKALTTQYIQLSPTHLDPRQQELTLSLLTRAKSQHKLLETFLSMSRNQNTGMPDAGYPMPVERRALLEASGVGSAVLRTMMDKGIFCEQERTVSRLRDYTGETHTPHTLDTQQQRAVEQIRQSWQQKPVTLLHGVTSSGKTEVYIHLIHEMLQQGKQVLYLVPEIALTTQLTDRLQAVFGNQVVVYHSRFSSDERVEIYSSLSPIASSPSRLILGARSAIFLPFSNLGLVIVDEEHEPSYKQQDPAPRYHARSAAIMMAQWYGAKVLLGTATPSIESYHNAVSGKYGWVEMTERFRGLQLPKITMVDLQRQYHRKEMYGHLADPVVFRMREELARGKQVILFQNRRGYAPFLQCPQCGEVPKCPNCDVSMTYHKSNNTLVCHSCGCTQSSIANRPLPIAHCPKCGTAWKLRGIGTERLEEEIHGLFPHARVARMDLDSTRKKDAYQQIIDRFAQHEVDILIGTQMVTKGLHFDGVSLVVVLQADSLINQPDFRSAEHAFQMLEQVSGRAGRTGTAGEVMIQTFDAKNPLFTLLSKHDYRGLYEQQVSEREMFCFPPFHRLIVLSLRHRDERRLERGSVVLMEALRKVFGARVSGVITPLVSRRQNQYIRQLRLRVEQGANVQRAKQLLRAELDAFLRQSDGKGTVVAIDVDPQ